MMKTILGAAIALSAQPVLAQTATVAGAREARAAAAPVRAEPAGRVVAIPRGDGPSNREKAAELLRQAYQRAHNAVENGASPERVRHNLREYKQHLRERLYGGD